MFKKIALVFEEAVTTALQKVLCIQSIEMILPGSVNVAIIGTKLTAVFAEEVS